MADSYRYLDQALIAPYVQGVNVGFDDAGLRLRFIVRDPSEAADYVVIQQVVVDPTATEDFLNKLNTEYQMRKLAAGDEPEPGGIEH